VSVLPSDSVNLYGASTRLFWNSVTVRIVGIAAVGGGA